MATYKTPGVFIEEISTIPPSVAPLPTAIPGFVGYTEKAIINGAQWNYIADGPTPPIRIESLLEFEQIFGVANPETFSVTISGAGITPSRTTTNNFILYYQMKMFYGNGGGTCYIVSVGGYSAAVTSGPLENGIAKLEQIDEVTLLLAPESVLFSSAKATLYNGMLGQCTKLQDRFAIFDVTHTGNNTSLQDATSFRNNDVGPDNLKYGAAYYPQLRTALSYFYQDTGISIVGGTFNGQTLDKVLNGVITTAAVTSSATITLTALPAAGEEVVINTISLVAGTHFAIVAGNIPATAVNLFNAIITYISSVIAVSVVGAVVTIKAIVPGTIGTIIEGPATDDPPFNVSITPGVNAVLNPAPDKELYNRITDSLANVSLLLYPSAAIAGIYARVDSERGVWKAPANVGVRLVNEPATIITDQTQENLNVDSVSGKSINAIRFFPGRGVLVWGARTLAGNDNEWRYVNVRRLFIFVEESIKKATEFVVFEPNTATTWNRVRSMSEAFLTNLWKDGALAGATTKEAYFVNVGLGITMTAQDILEGKMIVEIGLAASRPAEFIILRFSHKLQES